jgi:beta-glucosidase-like glycosyl hydrolase
VCELRGHVCVSCVDVCERSCEDECCVRRSAGGRYFTEGALRAALANGSLTADTVSTMATHVLTSMYAVGQVDSKQPSGLPTANATSQAHSDLAEHLASAAAVLLKNERQLLPLSRTASVAVIGAAANCEAEVPPCAAEPSRPRDSSRMTRHWAVANPPLRLHHLRRRLLPSPTPRHLRLRRC